MSYTLAHAHVIYAHVGEERSQGCVSLLVGAGSERRVSGKRHLTPNTNLIE